VFVLDPLGYTFLESSRLICRVPEWYTSLQQATIHKLA
jgi:hypothetical protein